MNISTSSLRYCLDLVRRYDRNHLLCTTLLPAATRIPAQVLGAFNVEISLIDRRTTNSNSAQVRLSWWRQAIQSATEGTRVEHPVVEALGVLIAQHRYPIRWLNQIVESRDSDRMIPPETIADLESLSEAIHSSLLYLILHSGKVKDLHADHAASHVGKAIGLLTALQAIRFGYSSNLPRNLLQNPHIKLAPENEHLIEVVFEIASQAKAHIDHARSFRDQVPKEARSVLLPAIPASLYLKDLERAQFDVFRTPIMNPLRTQFSLLYHRLRSQY